MTMVSGFRVPVSGRALFSLDDAANFADIARSAGNFNIQRSLPGNRKPETENRTYS